MLYQLSWHFCEFRFRHMIRAHSLCVYVVGEESLVVVKSLTPEQLDVLNFRKVQLVRLVSLQVFKGLWTQSSSEPSKPMESAKLARINDIIGLFPKSSITSTLIPARNQTRKPFLVVFWHPPNFSLCYKLCIQIFQHVKWR